MRKMTLKDVASCLGLSCSVDKSIAMCAIDSRLVQPSGLFFAIEGKRVDGHDFAQDAKEKGAIGIVASKPIDIQGIEVFCVPNVQDVLQQLASWVYSQKRCRVIGVTGSVGKTSTKECIAQGLKEAFKVGFSPGSFNSQLTLPIAVLNCPVDADVCVLEYAMSEKGQIQRLVEIAPPDIGVITPIDYAHAENFASLEEIAAEKAQLFCAPNMQKGFVHYKSWDFVKDVGAFPKEVYGNKAKGPFATLALNENYEAAQAVGRFLGVEHLAEVQGARRRFEKVERDGVLFIDDSYNANVTSFKAAIEGLPKGKRLVGVLGSIGELGGFSQKCHSQVAGLANQTFDKIFYLGQDWKDLVKENGKLYASFDALKEAFFSELAQGDVVLIKGSNYHQLWRLLE